ncbi:MAG: DUF4421 domain-containing protein [Bacteroidaceae bacterium]|nr:DUF4421 domain-containing protein [Bacteroidaceae bacterium]
MQSYSKYFILGLLTFSVAAEASQLSGAPETGNTKTKNFFRAAWDWLIAPDETLDSTYIYQAPTNWTVSLENDLSRTGALFKTRGHLENLVHPTGSYSYLWDVRMQSEYSDVMGAYLTLGPITLGWGSEVGKQSAQSNNNQYFCLLDAWYGISFRYNSIYNPLRSTLYNYTTGFQRQINTHTSGHFRSLIVNAYYAFDHSRFAYNAAYDGSYIQRRSRGSMLAMAKYAYGDLRMPKNDTEFLLFCGGNHRYSTHQLSVGPGYSYNWVLFHRDAAPHSIKGLHNLTFNATLSPMLTLINRLNTYTGTFDENGDNFQMGDKISAAQKIHFNVFARAAACYSFGRYSLNATFDFNRFGLHTENTEVYDDEISTYKSKCRFYDWMASVMLNVKF